MKFYTNKTKPRCNEWVKALSKDVDGKSLVITNFFIVPKTKPYLEWCETHWEDTKGEIIYWQYADKFDILIKKRLNIKEKES